MDEDLDFSFNPSETVYPRRAIRLDPVNEGSCYQGQLNSQCIGISDSHSEFAPGMIGNQTYPYILAQVGDGSTVAVQGPMRNCLWDVDPAFAGQIRPGSLLISGNSGYCTLASPFGSFNQWILGIARSFATGGQACNTKVVIFPWLPTGS